MVTESYRGAQVRRDAIAAGADAFLSEPVPPEQLVRVVAKLVQERGASDLKKKK